MDPFCHHHRYGYISRPIGHNTYIFLCSLLTLPVSQEQSPVPKINNYIANFVRLAILFISLKLVKIIEILVIDFRKKCSYSIRKLRSSPRPISIGQLTHYCAYTSDLSTLLSARGLTSLRYGIPYLEASFTLRCFQRLSQPHSATLPCRWRDNRCTVGAFIPVLSY